MFSYRSILKQALSISWKNKHLWFFGLFASLAVAGGSMEYQFLTQSFGQGLINGSYQSLNGILATGELISQLWSGILNLFTQNFLIILNALTITLLALTIIAVFIWLAISSQAALVDNIKKILNPKKKAVVSTLREGLTIGHKHFWSVLWLNILIKVLVSFCFFIASLPLLFMVISSSYLFVVLYTILFVIFVPIAVSLSLIIKYAISYRVLENESTYNSLTKGVTLFKKNWLISIEVALILFMVSFFSTFIVLVVIAIVFFPILWVSLIFSIGWLSFLLVLICLFLIIVFGSFLTTFQIAAWTDLYLHLKADAGLAKLERIFQKK